MKQVPLPAKAVAFFWFFLPSVLAVLSGIVTFFIDDMGPIDYPLFDLITGILGGFGYLLIGAALFFFAKGVWQGKWWARIALITIAIVALIEILIVFVQNGSIPWYRLIVNLAILFYFTLNKKIKDAYAK